jgi:hypothetical protein
MSRKQEKTTEENKKKRMRKRKTKQTLTRAVTHIRLSEANPGAPIGKQPMKPTWKIWRITPQPRRKRMPL